VQKLKMTLGTTTSLTHAVTIAKAVRQLIPHIEEARTCLPSIPPLQAPHLVGNEDQITKLKKSTLPRVMELESVVDSMIVAITGKAGLEQLLAFSGIITSCLTIVQSVNQDNGS